MKVQNPIIGRSRGSAGGMTFCKVYDKNVARAKAFEVANPKTAAQTTQRNYFKELTALVATFTEEQLRFLFPNKPKAMSRRNALAKQLAEYFTLNAGVKSVNYASIDTIGNASTIEGIATNASVSGEQVVITIDPDIPVLADYQENIPAFLVVNVTKSQMTLVVAENHISEGGYNIDCPSNWVEADVIHAIILITNTQTANAGFGTMFVVKRPAKANA